MQVPLGNFELDWLIHAADIFFSRALRDQQQVFLSANILYIFEFSDVSSIIAVGLKLLCCLDGLISRGRVFFFTGALFRSVQDKTIGLDLC